MQIIQRTETTLSLQTELSHKSSLINYKNKALQDHFQQLCADKYADQRKVWRTIKPHITSRNNKHNRRIVLKDKDRIL